MASTSETNVTKSQDINWLDVKPNTLMDIPSDLHEEILLRLARMDYRSIHSLACTSRFFYQLCKEFIERQPMIKFTARAAGMSDSESDDCLPYEDSENDYDNVYVRQYDDAELLDEMLDRISFGSNYDSELDGWLHGQDDNVDQAGANPVAGQVGAGEPEEWW